MRAAIVRRPERLEVDVYLTDDLSRGAYSIEEGRLRLTHDVVPGAEMPVAFSLPYDALEAIVAEASDHLPPSAATADALADTRATRDRLLAIVEGQAARGQL